MAEQASAGVRGNDLRDRAQAWYTGASMASTQNGWDTAFTEEMFRQRRAAEATGTLGVLYDKPDFTGIITNDTPGGRRFGDVYQGGTKVGNLYTAYGREPADIMMADLMFSAQEKARLFEAGPDALSRAVNDWRAEEERSTHAYLTQKDYEAEVQATAEGWQAGGGDEAVSLLGGAAGGAATGAGIGAAVGALFGGVGAAPAAVVGGVIGGIAGGIGAFLNRDELTLQAARAKVQQDQAGERFGTAAGITTGLMGWGNLGMKAISPAGNLLRGIYDAAQGTVGDTEAEWYAVDQETLRPARTGAMTALDVSASVLDAIGQFANPAAVNVFMASMGTTIAGRLGQAVTTGGYAFNDRSGQFENFVLNEDGSIDTGSLLAGIGAIGIDVVQMGMARGVIAKATGQTAAVERALSGAAPQELQGMQRILATAGMRMSEGAARKGVVTTQVSGGFSYGFNAAGEVVGRRATVGLLAPSEAVKALEAGARARLAARKNGALAVDDYYRAANELELGDRVWRSAVVNGFGEGSEEAIQAVLEPMMFDETADPNDVLESFVYGAAMGLGMGLGSAAQGKPANERMYAQAFLLQKQLNGTTLTREAWDKMTQPQRQALLVVPQAFREGANAAAKNLEHAHKKRVVAQTYAIERREAALQRMQLAEAGKLSNNVDDALVITSHADLETHPPNAAVTSLAQMRYSMRKYFTALDDASKDEGLEDGYRTIAANALAHKDVVLARIEKAVQEWRAAGQDKLRQTQAIVGLNTFLREQFYGGTGAAAKDLARARSVSPFLARDPHTQTGSYQTLLPQVDVALTRSRANNLLMAPYGVLQALGGDFDGDKLRTQALLVLDDESFTNSRIGMNLLGASESVNIKGLPFEHLEVELAMDAYHSGNAILRAVVNNFIKQTRYEITKRYSAKEGFDQQELAKLLNAWSNRVRTGIGNARTMLLDDIANNAVLSGQMDAYSRRHLTNDWLELSGIIHRRLQAFQRAYSGKRPVDPSEGPIDTVAMPTKRQPEIRERRRKDAATYGQTIGLHVPGHSMFRKFQGLHYTVYTAHVQGTLDALSPEVAELIRMYEQLGQGMTRLAVLQQDAKDEITAKLLYQLKAFAMSTGKDTSAQSLVLLAMTRSWDVVDGKLVSGSLAQILLRRILEKDRVEKAAVVTPELEARWLRYDQLVKAGQESAAMIEALGSMALYDLLGDAAESLGADLTLEQALRVMTTLSPDQKQALKWSRQLEPEYLQRTETHNPPYGLDEVEGKNGQVSAYRAIVDALHEVSSKRVTLTDKGLSAGELGDAPGGRSARTSAQFKEGIVLAQDFLRKLQKLRGIPLETGDQISAAFDQMPDLAREVLKLIPYNAVNAAFEVVGGKLVVDNWVADMLTMPPDQALMHYWRSKLLMTWNAIGGAQLVERDGEEAARAYSGLKSRMHRLIYALAKANDGGIAQAKFVTKLEQSTSLEDFMMYVNNTLRGEEAPYVAWFDDVADFDIDKAGGGLSQVSDGAEMREAILDFRDGAQRQLEALNEVLLNETTDVNTVANLLRAVENENAKAPVDPVHRRMLTRLDAVIKEAAQKRSVASPNDALAAMTGAILGLYTPAHVKGQTARPFVGLGKAEALGAQFRYATGIERTQATWRSVSVDDVSGNLPVLAGATQRIMDNEGRLIDWPGLTRKAFLDAFMQNPNARPALLAMVADTAWETSADGTTSLRLLQPTTLTALLQEEPNKHLFKSSFGSRMQYFTAFESRVAGHKAAGEYSLQSAATVLGLSRTSALRSQLTEEQAMRMSSRATVDIVRVLQVVGELAANGANFDELVKDMRDRISRRRLAKRLGLDVDGLGEFSVELLSSAFEDYAREMEDRVLPVPEQGDMSPDEWLAAMESVNQANAEITREIEETRLMTQALMSSNPFNEVRLLFELGSDAAINAVRKPQILRYVLSHGSLEQRGEFARDEILRLRQAASDPAAPVDADGMPLLSRNPEQNEQRWRAISGAVISTYLDELTSTTAANVAVPLYSPTADKKLFQALDPTFMFLVDDLLDPDAPFVEIAKEMHLLGGGGRAGNDIASLEKLIEETILDEKQLGPWTSDIALSVAEMWGRYASAASEPGIQQSGLPPARQATISAAMDRSFEKPDASLLSTVTVPLAYLKGLSPEQLVPFTLTLPNGSTMQSEMPLAQLNGRFAGNVEMVRPDPANPGTPKFEARDLWTRPNTPFNRYYTGDATVAASGYRPINVDHLIKAAEYVAGGNATGDLEITISFFHPDTKGSDGKWLNNVYFDGLSFAQIADQQKSLNAGFWFAHGGVSGLAQARNLEAQKYGKRPLKFADVPKAFEEDGRDDLEKDWDKDLAAVLRRKSLRPILVDVGEGYLIRPEYFNSLYKNEQLRHYVRGIATVNGEPKPELWNAERVITWQRQNPGKPLPLQHAELWIPSEEVLLLFLGERGGQAAPSAHRGAPSFDPAEIKPWAGDTDKIVEQLPDVLEFDYSSNRFKTFDLFETRVAALTRHGVVALRPAVDPATLTRLSDGLAYKDSRRSAIYGDRQHEYRNGGEAGVPSQLRADQIEAFKRAANGLDIQAAGLPFFPARSQRDASYAAHLATEISTFLKSGANSALWVYEAGRQSSTRNWTTGVLGELDMNDETTRPKHAWVAPDDRVVINLERIEEEVDPEHQLEHAKRVVDKLTNWGATILLPDGQTGGDLRGYIADYIERRTYRRLAGSKYIFVPDDAGGQTMNQRARSSTTTSIEKIHARSLALVLVSKTLPFDDNSAAQIDGDITFEREVNLLPTNAYGQFNVPRSPRQVQQVRHRLQGLLNNDELLRHLVKQAGKGNAPADPRRVDQLKRDLTRMFEAAEPGGVLPAPGAEFRRGSIVPLVGLGGQIILYRHGHKAIDPADLHALFNAPLNEGEDGVNIAIYKNEPEPTHSTHDGRVVRIQSDSVFGLRIHMDVRLQDYGDKLQLDGLGMKYLLTTWSKKAFKLPKWKVFNHWGFNIAAATSDTASKEGFGGYADNLQDQMTYLGIDFTPELVQFFFGVSWEQLSEGERLQYDHRLNEILQFARRNLPKYNDVTVHRMLRTPAYSQILEGDLTQLVGKYPQRFADTQREWQLQLAEEANPVADIARAVLGYLLYHDARVEDVLRVNGVVSDPDIKTNGGWTHKPPALFTDYLAQLAVDRNGPLRTLLVKKLGSRIYNPVQRRKDGARVGYFLTQDFQIRIHNEDPADDFQGVMQFASMHSSGDNPINNGFAATRNTKQRVSRHAMSVAYQAIGARTGMAKRPKKTEKFAKGEGVVRFGPEGSLWNLLNAIPENDKSWLPWMQLNPAERLYKQLARDAVGTYRKELDTSKWSEDEAKAQDFVNAYERLRLDIVHAYGLPRDHAFLVDYWIRQRLGQPLGDGDAGRISATAAIASAQDILKNAQAGYLPTHDGQVAQLHATDLQLLYRAFEKNARFAPRLGHKSKDRAKNWDQWVTVALAVGDLETTDFNPVFLLESDGLMHTYVDADRRLGGLPVSRSVLQAERLLDPESARMVATHAALSQQGKERGLQAALPRLSRDPRQQHMLEVDPLRDMLADSVAELMGAERRGGKYEVRPALASVQASREAAMKRWHAQNDVPTPLPRGHKSYYQQGTEFINSSVSTNALLRTMTNMRLAMATLNPLLYLSAGPEMWVRSMHDTATNLLLGDATTGVGRAAGAVGTRVAEATGAVARPRLTSENHANLARLYESLGQRSDFRAMLYGELHYLRPALPDKGIERWTAQAARLGSRIQDPTWGMRGQSLARRYVEAALREIAADPINEKNVLDVDYIVAKLSVDPLWLQKNHRNAHDAGKAAIARVRSLQPTVLSMTLRGVYEPLSQNPHLLFAVPATLGLKLPLMFSTYASNVAMNVLGLQGVNALTAMFLHGRKKGLIGRIQNAFAGKQTPPDAEYFDMSAALEGIDLTRAIAEAGISHSALFAFGLMAGGLGLSGEDEEDRRRRRAAEYQGASYIYDPRDIENDFRNADALYLNWLPAGLQALFMVGDGENATAMAQPHWLLRQFISPIIGMERYFDTGDPRQLLWGFQDAIGAFPLINSGTWADTVSTFSLLHNASTTFDVEDDEDAAAATAGLVMNGVMQLEKMLLESSFVNSLYVAQDQYDRNPWVMPLTTGEDVQWHDKLGLPEQTDAVTSFVNADGEVQEGYVGRTGTWAQLYAYSETRGSLAMFMSLITGQPSLDSNFLRQNMTPKVRTFDKPAFDQQEAEALILSIWDAETGIEVLTDTGARAVMQGLWKGSVTLDSPSLEGVFIPYEMRQAIQEAWMEEIIQEGIDLGLTQYQAEKRLRTLWYGPTEQPSVPGIKDYLWSDQISYSPKLEYYQLNTTYSIGPDGRPWATGIDRHDLFSAFGLTPINRYYNGTNGDLPTDERGNSIDQVAGINTGLRGLQRKEDNFEIPTDAELAAEIERAINNAANKLYTPYSGYNGYGGGGYSRGGGGGGGGYARLNAPVRSDVPYGQTIPFLNTATPIIRRASLHRERFSSDRGRLKQWQ